MIVRPASLEDLPAITAIYDHEVLYGTSTFDTEPRSPEAQRAWWDSHQNDAHPLLVAADSGPNVLGWGCLSAWSPRGAYARTVEGSVFVDPQHRQRGVGGALLSALTGRARAVDHRVVLGRIEASNDASRRMLLGAGFSSVGVMHAVGEKFGRVLDVELFERVLRSASLAIVCVAFGLAASACTTVPEIPVSAEFHGTTVETTVDSEIARDYLEAHPPATGEERELGQRISALHRRYDGSIPTREELREISREHSVDFAAAFFADRLLNDHCNARLNENFRSHLASGESPDPQEAARYTILFVPGWDYVESGIVTGADFARPRALAARMGFDDRLVGIPPNGSVEENASIVAVEIEREAQEGKRILVAGASSAGPAIHLALAKKLAAVHRTAVKAWINLGGLLQGTPLIDYLQVWPLRWLFRGILWWEGWEEEAVLSMSAEVSRERFAELAGVDTGVMTINYLGIPLSGQVSRFASDKYPLMRGDGPNDGLTLVADVIAPRSLTIVAFGRDHFFAEDPTIDRRAIALMSLVLDMIEEGCDSDCRRGRRAASSCAG